MPDLITLAIDGQSVTVAAGTTVVAAIAIAALEADDRGGVSALGTPGTPGAAGDAHRPENRGGPAITRRSVGGMLRGPVCGMGVCQECRVTIDGRAHQVACQTLCAPDMQVRTARAENAA